jgi:hypothetical protein
MAKKTTKTQVAPAINAVLLGKIVDASRNGGFTYATPAEVASLVEAGLVEVNEVMTDGAGGYATRATQAGFEAIGEVNVPATETAVSVNKFEVAAGFVPPVKTRGRKPSTYPFETMNVGDTFFVAASEKMPDPGKSLQSTVGAANARFAEDVPGEFKKNRKGEDVAVRRNTKMFKVVAVEAGKVYGNFTAPANGAVVWRAE